MFNISAFGLKECDFWIILHVIQPLIRVKPGPLLVLQKVINSGTAFQVFVAMTKAVVFSGSSTPSLLVGSPFYKQNNDSIPSIMVACLFL